MSYMKATFKNVTFKTGKDKPTLKIDYTQYNCGIFTFNDNGEMASFITDAREATETDGTTKKVRWTAICSNYKESAGIKKPTILKAIWHYNEGDQIYFNAKASGDGA